MKQGRTLQELAIELDRQAQAKRDLKVDLGALRMEPEPVTMSTSLRVGTAGSYEAFSVNDIAHRQIGQHLKIPAAYYDRMKEEYPELLAENVNGWFGRNPSKSRMLRTLDGTARAFLSDRYRRIDNQEIAETVLPIIGNIPDATVESSELTDMRMYIKVVTPRITAEIVPGDPVQAGVVITNSEVGHGSVNVRPLIYRLVCSNGMIAEDGGMRKYHVGRVIELGEDEYEVYRDETVAADDRAFLMKIEDVVRAAVDQAKFNGMVERMREAKEARLDTMAIPEVVELTAREFKITENEGKGILGHLIEGGDLSLYGLGNAVTRHAHDVQSYDRSTELERIGYKIVTMHPRIWKRINAGVA